ncbi:hypothetical protein BN7_1031 [Wickerhamomyces ciferrii]|uniref:Glycoside hydrolase family 5 C-terminal domain-containing protein n=1 Tax=Wickerhamomyces ciferrii (strain ATCC 14091 / BCRC 22168 / CBS 111 / JCM 3599 / NBRC 0793 / NRRL Y-1031 F-60-10) TaxID=1206466 RepID=K0K9A5_WICCF|nr:uncharacterized protein BN7_1031 [Wickerhamomyces ciferrii]CCH41490.1 hypothetical protein BN7_1031 [Wickerhamomyces ciferrii]
MTKSKGKVRSEKGQFVDDLDRVVQLKGINLDGGAKFPTKPSFPTHKPLEGHEGLFFDGDHVSFAGRPFPLEDVPSHINRIKSLGYNSIRYIFTWEAIEHEGPGKYDEEFIDYTIEVLKIIDDIGGIYVYLDPHQDVWSRFSGGDGAPLWTLYAAGFDPKHFQATEAAVVQNFYHNSEDPDVYPKMVWSTNYKRLAAGTLFTLFFAGKQFAPNAIINGVNIQDYLQSHFINSVAYFVKRINDKAPELFEETVIGVETINEPNPGYIGTPDASKIPDSLNLRVGTCPTIYQTLKLGSGIPTELDEYRISIFGPKKIGTKVIDPKGVKAWVSDDTYDRHYGFKRSESWKLGVCIWEQHGVWNSETTTLLLPDYFNVDHLSGEIADEELFINRYFVNYYKDYRKAIRDILPDTFIFLQSPPLEIPPKLKGTNLVDKNTIFSPHYYDGMSLMFKTWNRKYNADTLGIMRGKYSNPVFSIVWGENNIRKSFRRQLAEMVKEGKENLGEELPVIFTEIGMPFDMDDKKAYRENEFSSQTSALDALGFALEGSNISHSWWTYTADNGHKWGDYFNNEDFSFWSKDDIEEASFPGSSGSTATTGFDSKAYFNEHSISVTDFDSDSGTLAGSSSLLKSQTLKGPSSASSAPSHFGLRAIDSIVRPFALALEGEFVDSEFDLSKLEYTLKIKGKDTGDITPTLIHIPQWHFPSDEYEINVTSGKFIVEEGSETLQWFHENGYQSISIRNINAKTAQKGWLSYLLSFLPCFS